MAFLAGLWAVGKWLLIASVKVVLWAVSNPLGAVFVAAFLMTGAQVLRAQPWAGSDLLADMLYGVGKVFAWAGGTVLVGRAIWGFVPARYRFLALFIYARVLHWLEPFAIPPVLREIKPGPQKNVPQWQPGGPVWEGPPGF